MRKHYIQNIIWACSGLLMSCVNDVTPAQQEKVSLDTTKAAVATLAGYQPQTRTATRTTATHVKGTPVTVFWENTDRIWVKADDGVYRQSDAATFPIMSNKAQANFKLFTGYYHQFNPEVRYTNTSSEHTVIIQKNQNQSEAGKFNHLGASGDCGTATAIGGGGDFKFTLQHKAAYLCLYPRIANAGLCPNIRLEKITVLSTTVPIAGTYNFSDGKIKDKTPTTPSNSITLNTNSAVLSTTTSDAKSFCVVLCPNSSTLTLNVVYTIKDPLTQVSVDITKSITETFGEGEIYDYTAWLDKDILFINPKFFTWDAQREYWFGYENEQPILSNEKPGATTGPNYPKLKTDPRWYHENPSPSTPSALAASRSCAVCPTVNELCWYVMKGEPHYDSNKPWSFKNHLYKGGTWLKKKATILQDNPSISTWRFTNRYPDANGVDRDWRTETSIKLNENPLVNPYISPSPTLSVTPKTTPLSNPNEYFFLPSLGSYLWDKNYYMGATGYFWGQDASPNSLNAFALYCEPTKIYVGANNRINGFAVQAFE